MLVCFRSALVLRLFICLISLSFVSLLFFALSVNTGRISVQQDVLCEVTVVPVLNKVKRHDDEFVCL